VRCADPRCRFVAAEVALKIGVTDHVVVARMPSFAIGRYLPDAPAGLRWHLYYMRAGYILGGSQPYLRERAHSMYHADERDYAAQHLGQRAGARKEA
jgi:hypothetical protein